MEADIFAEPKTLGHFPTKVPNWAWSHNLLASRSGMSDGECCGIACQLLPEKCELTGNGLSRNLFGRWLKNCRHLQVPSNLLPRRTKETKLIFTLGWLWRGRLNELQLWPQTWHVEHGRFCTLLLAFGWFRTDVAAFFPMSGKMSVISSVLNIWIFLFMQELYSFVQRPDCCIEYRKDQYCVLVSYVSLRAHVIVIQLYMNWDDGEDTSSNVVLMFSVHWKEVLISSNEKYGANLYLFEIHLHCTAKINSLL